MRSKGTSPWEPLKKHGDKMEVGRLGGSGEKRMGLVRQVGQANRKPRRSNLRNRAASAAHSSS